MPEHTHIGLGQYINGRWVLGEGKPLQSLNPANNSILWEGFESTQEQAQEAAHAARSSLDFWSNTSFEERASHCLNFAKAVQARKDELALLIAKETGKPLWEAKTEVSALVNKIQISINAYQERTWPKTTSTPEAKACLRFKAHGVVVVLGAFNLPAHLSCGHMVPALLAGNTLLYKPSEQTPAVGEWMVDCWHRIGLPPGVLNALQGGASVGGFMLESHVQGVYFTGSYASGLRIHQHFADRPEVLLALEMGGNNPLVVEHVQNLKAAVYHTLLSSFITSGQRCSCARRILIQNNQEGDDFLALLLKSSKALRIGAYHQDPEPFMGPVISQTQALYLLEVQKKLRQMGAHSLLDMKLLQENSALLTPGILDMSSVSQNLDEEYFGPLMQVYRYDDFDQALYLANQTQYGLTACLLSDSEEQYKKFYKNMRAGLINWNRPTTGASSSLPFGGVGHSGNHRPSAYFAADYCSYPIASMEQSQISLPEPLLPGIDLNDRL
jgi:succinylglutamic semialdehyde dehydrogenase